MENDNETLSPKELMFCSCFVAGGNETEAAIKAGYKNSPELVGLKLLCREDILDRIKKLNEMRREAMKGCAYSGFERLAFGNISDAVSLLYMENPSVQQLESLNLYNVSEIKRPKEGVIEIKFFDRLRALEKLEQMSGDDKEQDNSTYAFYKALEQGAKAAEKISDDD